ncbi:DUF3306 domain-containing protein [Sagittula sp. S175]|uniref:DUF3306 domain-containing protein n=1 Tax=Sagittula sp. S175 TaxID=3415129 RepID=UPI003C7A2764
MSFWERRKAAVAAEAQAEDAARIAAEKAATEQALAEKSDEQLLAEAGLPEPEQVENGEQLRAFLQAQLPQRLKNRALRQLWRSNPVLANLDGLLEYGEDYTDAARCVPDMKTVYQVGKGMFDKFAEEAAQAARAEDGGAGEGVTERLRDGEPDLAPPASDQPVPEQPQTPEPETSEPIAAAQPAPETAPYEITEPDTSPAPVARRMRFRFET